MYCPKCGTQNVEDASFCRGCGANLGLVTQALAGHVPAPIAEGKRKHGRPDKDRCNDQPNLTFALVKTFVGIAFIFVALAVKGVPQIAGHIWWFWMLIPAAGSLGAGVAEFVRLYQHSERPQQLPSAHAYVPPAIQPALRTAELPPRRAGADFYTPASVTENTTKLLEKDQ